MSDHLLFATIAAGGGHVATARAMAQAVRALEPDRRTRVSDLMLELGFERQDRQHKDSWRWLLARPRLVRVGQRVLDAAPGVTVALYRRWLDDLAQRAAEVLMAERPALVVANHGFLATALTRAQRRYGMELPLVVFATEPLDASALWAEPEVERMVAPSEAARSHLLRLGVPAARCDVVGYPVQRAFLQAPARAAARAALGLEARFTCLLALGGEGIVREPEALVRPLLQRGLQVVAVAGRNHELQRRLEALAAAPATGAAGGRLLALGFTERMAECIAAADVVVGKAGPASSMEALAVGRPLALTSYAGLNERAVVRFVRERQLGAYLPTTEALEAAADAWLTPDGEAALRSAERRTAELDFAGMSRDLGRYLLFYAQHRRPPEAWTSRGLS